MTGTWRPFFKILFQLLFRNHEVSKLVVSSIEAGSKICWTFLSTARCDIFSTDKNLKCKFLTFWPPAGGVFSLNVVHLKANNFYVVWWPQTKSGKVAVKTETAKPCAKLLESDELHPLYPHTRGQSQKDELHWKAIAKENTTCFLLGWLH